MLADDRVLQLRKQWLSEFISYNNGGNNLCEITECDIVENEKGIADFSRKYNLTFENVAKIVGKMKSYKSFHVRINTSLTLRLTPVWIPSIM